MSSPRHTLATRRIVAPLLVLASACFCATSAEAKPYKGAEVYSQTQHRFGRVEVRMRMARGSGILSTFFTYKQGSEAAGAAWEEIDVEGFGKANATTWQSNILVGNPRVGSEQVHQAGLSLADGYHTFTIEWTPTAVVWLVDGVEARRTNGGQANQLTSLHNFRFNIWASDVSSWAGAFEASALPASQYVNWIRYYRYEGGTFVLDWSDDFNTFDTARWAKANWTFGGNLVDFEPNNAVVRDGTLVLCMTTEGQVGCSGAVPPDSTGNGGSGGSAGAGGSGNGGAGGTTAGGGAAGSGGVTSAAGTGGAGTSGAAGSGGTTVNGGASAGGNTSAGGGAGLGGVAGSPLGSGGAQAIAGAQGTSGAAAVNAGSSSGDSSLTPGQPASESGCGCVVAATNGSARANLLWVACALLLTRVRGSRRRATARTETSAAGRTEAR
jgi:uncharacterized membrane protein YgcG